LALIEYEYSRRSKDKLIFAKESLLFILPKVELPLKIISSYKDIYKSLLRSRTRSKILNKVIPNFRNG